MTISQIKPEDRLTFTCCTAPFKGLSFELDYGFCPEHQVMEIRVTMSNAIMNRKTWLAVLRNRCFQAQQELDFSR